jgi:hypothetical protein
VRTFDFRFSHGVNHRVRGRRANPIADIGG